MACTDRPPPLEFNLLNDPNGFDPYASNVLILGFGVPIQRVKLSPATAFNNTAVHVTPPCSNSTDLRCSPANYGGIYTTTSSTTYKAASFSSWNGSQNAGQSSPDSIFFNELVSVTNNLSLDGVPVVGLGSYLNIPNVFGIGPNSLIVSQAYTAGITTSRSWSLYAGSTTTPGSLILGGYSDEFVDGDLLGYTEDELGCLLCTQVDSMTLDTANGAVQILRPGQNPFTAYFEPFANWLSFPAGVYSDWVGLTNGTVGEQGFTVYNDANVPRGNLTVRLTNGISVTIPQEQLFTNHTINGNGFLLTPSSGTQIAKIKGSTVANALGFPFLSHVYIIHDDEHRTLNISKAAPNATSNGKLTRVCPVTTATSLISNNNNSTLTPGSSSSSNHNYAGVIAGAVVGSVAFLAAILVILFFVLLHKRKRWSDNKQNSMPPEKDSRDVSPSDYSTRQDSVQQPVEVGGLSKVEMPTHPTRYELPANT